MRDQTFFCRQQRAIECFRRKAARTRDEAKRAFWPDCQAQNEVKPEFLASSAKAWRGMA